MRQLTRYIRPAQSKLTTAMIVCVALVAGEELANAVTWTPTTSASPAAVTVHRTDGRAPGLQADAPGRPAGAVSAAE